MEWIFLIAVLWIVFTSLGRFFKNTPQRPKPLENSSHEDFATISIRITTTENSDSGFRQLSPQQSVQRADDLWLSRNSHTTIGQYRISRGFIYVGTQLPSISHWRGTEPSLINPNLVVDAQNPSYSGQGMSYWPSYANIPAPCRAAYLDWLSSERSDPKAYIGYVFLYFYGIERRLLEDAKHSESAKKDAAAIIDEVERLLKIYGSNNSFKGYGTSFLQLAKLLYPSSSTEQQSPSYSFGLGEFPIDVRVTLAQLSKDQKPLSADWALAWYVGHPETRLRTPGKRCWDEFHYLFKERYKNQFPNGLLIKPNKTKLKISYRPASASFGGPFDVPINDLPDPAMLKEPFNRIRGIAEACLADLEAYSRFLGKNPNEAHSLPGTALLPRELLLTRETGKAQDFKNWLSKKAEEKDIFAVSGAELIGHWTAERRDRLSKTEFVALTQVLEALGYGVEPDVRFGGPTLTAATIAMLFPIQASYPQTPSASYGAATLLLHLAAAVASSDGDITEAEERHLEEYLATTLELTPGEHQRLSAHLDWLLKLQPTLTGVKAKLKNLDESGKESVAHFCIRVAGSDGRIEPAEIKTLGKIYKLLGRDPEEIYSHIHSFRTAEAGTALNPVTIMHATAEAGYRIPAPQLTDKLELDTERILRIHQETQEAAQFLGKIFAEEEVETEVVDKPAAGPNALTADPVTGFAAAHSKLLKAIATKRSWSRDEFESLAVKENLLPDGAYDAVNEIAIDATGEPLLEGEDPIEVNHDVLKELST